tara:strand:+ start:222 stop:1310 length:1089 start_codon:yes stop_codon:yes gene_type:complete
MTIKSFLTHQIEALSKEYSVTLIANYDCNMEKFDWLPANIIKKNIPILRKISMFNDFKALFLLTTFLNKEKFSLIYSITPKAGLLSMVASSLLIIPNRIHIFTGQVWSTKKGIVRFFLKMLDKLIAKLATKILVDGNSQRNFLIEEGVLLNHNSLVLGNGSISGVDVDRFKFNQKKRDIIRQKFKVEEAAIVLLFLGRINKEKGVLILADAFSKVQKKYLNSELWFVGPDEEKLQMHLQKTTGVRTLEFTNHPEEYMISADIFCLPSYREGFGTVIIEAAACGVPSIGSDIYGLRDSIIDGETGILFPVGSSIDLEKAIEKLIEDKILRKKMGKLARLRAIDKFTQKHLTNELIFLFKNLLK